MRRVGKKEKNKTFCTFTRCPAIWNFSLLTNKQTDRKETGVVKVFKGYGTTSVTLHYGMKHNFLNMESARGL